MTVTQLKYAVAVDDHRSFSRAADRCRVTQPSLSAQIKKLENELGVEIFDRSTTPVRPTDAGRRIVRQARLVLGELGRLSELVHDGSEVAGELHVGVLPTVAPCILTRFMVDLTTRHPGLRLKVAEQRTDEIVENLQKGRLDAGLLATPVDNPDLRERILFREPFVAYLSPEHRLSSSKRIQTDQLRREDLWLLREGHCFRDQVLDLCAEMNWDEAEPPALRFESGNLETLSRLVETKGGMTLLPSLILHGMTDDRRKHVRSFDEPAPVRTLRLVHRRANVKQVVLEAFADEFLALVRRELPDAAL
ncbi:MAG: hydrogen peroxide-inducible genes activator [Gemmatimonadota bacterium]|nr:hydrogen peroxide-inducible genes activator [Gemmatimonadota bacterium]